VRPEELGKLKTLIHPIWLRIRDFPSLSTVPQPLRYRLPLIDIVYNHKRYKCFMKSDTSALFTMAQIEHHGAEYE
jgi:hypothetical protein